MEICLIPHCIIKRISKNDLQQINWNIFISSLLTLIVFLLISFEPIIEKIPHVCLIKYLFGIPCPGCGIIRSIQSLYRLNIADSIAYNPNGILIIFSIFAQIPLRLFAILDDNQMVIVNKISLIFSRVILITLFVFWIFQLLTFNF
jgi:hypothetical protein